MSEDRVTTKDLLETLEGTETWSIAFEGLVLVQDGKFHVNDRIFRPTSLQVHTLWDEYFEAEMGSTSQVMQELEEEFGYGRR